MHTTDSARWREARQFDADCPVVGVRTGAPIENDGVTGDPVDRLPPGAKCVQNDADAAIQQVIEMDRVAASATSRRVFDGPDRGSNTRSSRGGPADAQIARPLDNSTSRHGHRLALLLDRKRHRTISGITAYSHCRKFY